MREIPEDVLFDKRLVQRYIREGLISQKDLDARLKALDDAAAQGEYLAIEGGRAQLSEP